MELINILVKESNIVKEFTFRFMRVLHKIPWKMFHSGPIVLNYYIENVFLTNLGYLLRQEGKYNWKELMQKSQFIEEYIRESNANHKIILGRPQRYMVRATKESLMLG
jgi:hypothetical protein